MFTLCADGYLDIEADVAFRRQYEPDAERKRHSVLGKVLGKIHRDSTTFDDDSWNAQIEQFPPRTKGCSALLAVHSSVSVTAKVEKAERVRAPLSLRVRIVCSLFLRVLRPVEKENSVMVL